MAVLPVTYDSGTGELPLLMRDMGEVKPAAMDDADPAADCCCGSGVVVEDCEVQYCCNDTPFPLEASVTFPDCGAVGSGGPKTLTGLDGFCYFRYDLAEGGIFYSFQGYHDCDTDETCVVAWMWNPGISAYVLWYTVYDDPDGSVFCGRAYEIDCHDDFATHPCNVVIDLPGSGISLLCGDNCDGPVTATI